jgi:hypothetical protein
MEALWRLRAMLLFWTMLLIYSAALSFGFCISWILDRLRRGLSPGGGWEEMKRRKEKKIKGKKKGMRLYQVWDLFREHNKETCGTYKLYVKLKKPTIDGCREGYIYLDPEDGENPLVFDWDEDRDDLEIEVKSVWCPYCRRVIYP